MSQLIKGDGSVGAANYFLMKNAVRFCKAMQKIRVADVPGETGRSSNDRSSAAHGRRHISVRTFDGPSSSRVGTRRRDNSNRRSLYGQDYPENLEEQFNKRLFSLTEGFDENSETTKILSRSRARPKLTQL
jgi:hypothetical protein